MPAEAADSVNDPRAALHEDLRPDPPTIGDGLGRAARMGGEEPARYFQSADHHRGCPQFPDDRLPVPAAAVLPGDRWRREQRPRRAGATVVSSPSIIAPASPPLRLAIRFQTQRKLASITV
jgi:hypothetical protein